MTVAVVGVALAVTQFVAPFTDALYGDSITPPATTVLIPRPDTPFVDPLKEWQEAVEEVTQTAQIIYQPERSMVVGTPMIVEAVVTLDVSIDPRDVIGEGGIGSRIDVGLQTEARLVDAACPDCAFSIDDPDWQTKEFAFDSNELSWAWRVMPNRCGDFSLTLQTRPVLRMGTETFERLEMKAASQQIGVQAYPDQAAVEAVLQADRFRFDLQPGAGRPVVGDELTLTVELDSPPPAEVDLVATLTSDDSSLVVEPEDSSMNWSGADPLAWKVSTLAAATAQLEFSATSERSIPEGCPVVEVRRTFPVTVDDPPPGAASRANQFLGWGLGTVAAVIGIWVGIISIRNHRRKASLSGDATADDVETSMAPADVTASTDGATAQPDVDGHLEDGP